MADETGRSANGQFQLRWTLARKIGGLASLLVFLLLVNSLYNYRVLGKIRDEMSEVADADLPVTKLITQLQKNSLQEHITLERVLRLVAATGDDARAERDRAATDFER